MFAEIRAFVMPVLYVPFLRGDTPQTPQNALSANEAEDAGAGSGATPTVSSEAPAQPDENNLDKIKRDKDADAAA
ncbi:hypothetical protein KIH07_23550 [Hydrogenophaga taeniospiralis]|uniref:hypothetical protein n=1 Tax=Hydrogenophaga taeniospiralis TaxID=65656 RepID=UPI001CFBF381|nr:hypothetical protein [Hydrogenophaga taeniospiralis]MCB4366722.1 hypothetical protein [Hydrogenophaga taeniospiralis]